MSQIMYPNKALRLALATISVSSSLAFNRISTRSQIHPRICFSSKSRNSESLSTLTKATRGSTFSNLRLGPNAPPPGLIRSSIPSFPWHKLPNWLTYLRCFAIPGIVVLFYMEDRHIETSILFALSSLTDWLDGYLARRWNITSAFGAFLDPVADKLMVSTSLILLTGRYGAVTAIPTAIILAREIAVSALREWMASKSLRDIVQVGFQGKIKTALSMAALNLMFLVPRNSASPLAKLWIPSLILLYICAGITVTSGSVYFRAASIYLLDTEPKISTMPLSVSCTSPKNSIDHEESY